MVNLWNRSMSMTPTCMHTDGVHTHFNESVERGEGEGVGMGKKREERERRERRIEKERET